VGRGQRRVCVKPYAMEEGRSTRGQPALCVCDQARTHDDRRDEGGSIYLLAEAAQVLLSMMEGCESWRSRIAAKPCCDGKEWKLKTRRLLGEFILGGFASAGPSRES
jgi:hypothetical protein